VFGADFRFDERGLLLPFFFGGMTNNALNQAAQKGPMKELE